MRTNLSYALLALGVAVAPLSAQIRPRTDPGRTRTSTGTVVLPDGRVVRTPDATVGSRSSSRIPPGQLPPRGMCRVWIDGVPPGHQPAVTDCATARAEAAQTPNSRVIYGDVNSFPGRGNGKFRNRRGDQNCVATEAVVIGGQVMNVCRDANGNVITDGRNTRRARGDDDEDDQNEAYENEHEGRGRGEHGNRGKGHGKHGKHGDD